MAGNALHQAQALESRAHTLSQAVRNFRLQQGTADEAVALVERAAALHGGHSREAFLRTVSDPAQPYHDRDMYVFALDATGTYRAFGGNPAKVGSCVQDIPGVAGEQLLHAIVTQAERAPGWWNTTSRTRQRARFANQDVLCAARGGFVSCQVYNRSRLRRSPASAPGPRTGQCGSDGGLLGGGFTAVAASGGSAGDRLSVDSGMICVCCSRCRRSCRNR